METATVTGRVRGTVRLRQDEVNAVCVLATSWASDRAFPRTVGVGVTFEIETSTGEVLRVDPFEAMVALPVRLRQTDGGVAREYGWMAPEDEVRVEGLVDREGPSRLPPALHATRITLVSPAGATHRLPPRTLLPGEPDEALPAAANIEAEPAMEPQAEPAMEPQAEPQTPHAEAAVQPAQEPPPQPRRKKKRHHDPGSTPLPT